MIILNAIRDFAGGLGRGVSLYFTERNDYTAQALTPALKAPRIRR